MLFGSAQAELGSVEVGLSDKKLSGTIYDAWCGNEKNADCKIKLDNERLIVNNGSGITVEQVTSIKIDERLFVKNRDPDNKGADHGLRCNLPGAPNAYYRPSCQVHFWIEYNDSSGDKRNALIRFKNKDRAYQLQDDLEAWSGIKFRERGPSVKIVH